MAILSRQTPRDVRRARGALVKTLLVTGALLLVVWGSGPVTASPPTLRPSAMTREVAIVGLDYAFQVPRELPAGPTTFRFENRGKVRHEFNIFLLKPGAKVDEVLALRKEGKSTHHLIEGTVGVLFANPGGRSSAGLATDLVADRDYAIICIFRDTAKAPRHFEMGMYSVIHVTSAGSRTQKSEIPTDTIDGLDYAFRAPAVVQPGRRWLAFRNQGKVAHELSIALLRAGVTVDSAVNVNKAGGDVDALFEPGEWGLLHGQPGQKILGRLDIDLLPGREYSIVCFFQDSAKAPPHMTLGMYGSVRVARRGAER